MSKNMPPSVPHEVVVGRLLKKRPGLAAAYVAVASEAATDDAGRVAFLRALRRVTKAKGASKVAVLAGIKLQSLSRALSDSGNPTLSTLMGITDSLGLKLVVVAAENRKKAPKKERGDEASVSGSARS